MRLKLCLYPGCEKLTQSGGYCMEHKALAEKRRQERKTGFNDQRGKSREWHSMYYSARWKQSRKEFLKKYPYCFLCGAKATIADHIQPHRGNVELFYNEDNLQPMCQSCHSKKTLNENDYFRGR